MPLNFRTEIRSMFGKEYIKVFLSNMDSVSEVKHVLLSAECVRNVNLSNNDKDLTVYPTKFYSAKETNIVVRTILDEYYKTSKERTILEDIASTTNTLSKHEKSRKLYEEVLNCTIAGNSSRSKLDNVRLALELYLQDVLSNKNTLEKQIKPLKDFLMSKTATIEVRTSITSSLTTFYKYQDDHVKHDDNIKEEDVDYFVRMANNIIQQIHKYE